MTVLVTWYRQKLDETWCAADTRISADSVPITDRGPKILPIPIVTHREAGGRWKVHQRHEIGFGFAGSVLSANNAYSI